MLCVLLPASSGMGPFVVGGGAFYSSSFAFFSSACFVFTFLLSILFFTEDSFNLFSNAPSPLSITSAPPLIIPPVPAALAETVFFRTPVAPPPNKAMIGPNISDNVCVTFPK